MSGREFFIRYRKIINILIIITAFLPKNMRQSILIFLRNRNGRVAMFGRYLLVRTLAKSCGQNVAIFPDVYFRYIERLTIGDNVSIHQMCYIDAEGEIEIGDNVSIAHRTTILSSNHIYTGTSLPIKYQGMNLIKTCIEDNVWIGCGCTVLAGVNISSGCVIGANSTVTKDISYNSVAVGSPAKVVKKRI